MLRCTKLNGVGVTGSWWHCRRGLRRGRCPAQANRVAAGVSASGGGDYFSVAGQSVHSRYASLCFAQTSPLELSLRVARDLTAVLFGIGPRRRRQGAGVKKGQCFFGMLPCQIFLTVGQVTIRQATLRIGRVRVRKQVEFKNLDRWLGFTCT